MTPEQFKILAAEYNRIPVMREVMADLDTPLSAYLKLANTPYSYLFESVHGGEKWGRYSIIGLSCNTVLSVTGNQLTMKENGEVIAHGECNDPLAEIETFREQFRVPDLKGIPRFAGGLVGFFGYDCVRYIEPRLTCDKDDPLQCPDIVLMVSDQVIVFDNLSGKIYIIVHARPEEKNAYDKALAELDKIMSRLERNRITLPVKEKRTVHEKDFTSGFTRDRFEQAVDRIKNYIVASDLLIQPARK